MRRSAQKFPQQRFSESRSAEALCLPQLLTQPAFLFPFPPLLPPLDPPDPPPLPFAARTANLSAAVKFALVDTLLSTTALKGELSIKTSFRSKLVRTGVAFPIFETRKPWSIFP